MALSRIQALNLFSECTGDDIWSVEHCEQRGVPDNWIRELADCFESDLSREQQTIFVDGQRTNQYAGIRDVDLALRLAEFLGIETQAVLPQAISRSHLVSLLREAIEDG